MFAAIARSYDLNNRLHSFGRDQSWRRAAVRAARVQPTDHVLDVACGTGDLARAFLGAKPARIVGLDFTPEMLAIARDKRSPWERADATRTIEYVEGDAQSLPFPDASFDVVSIAFGIRNVADPARAIAQFRRVLRPAGRLAILEFATPRNPLVAAGNSFYCNRVMPLTASLIARDRSGAYRYLPRSISTFASPEALADACRAAGFSRTDIRRLTLGVCACVTAFAPPA